MPELENTLRGSFGAMISPPFRVVNLSEGGRSGKTVYRELP
jgi:hypothetical protein